MSDIYRLHIQNFRSIRDATVDIAPLTVVYGPNGSGKSSLIYGLLTLKNFLTNPNQSVPSLFTYPSIGLGGWEEIVHRHSVGKSASFSIRTSNPEELSTEFTLTLEQSGGASGVSFESRNQGDIRSWPSRLDLPIAIPYRGNQLVDHEIALSDVSPGPTTEQENGLGTLRGMLHWNGITVSTQIDQDTADHVNLVKSLNEKANLPMELARKTGFVPLRRGFSKPIYSVANVTDNLETEDEVASLLVSMADRFQSYKISDYLEQITNRRVHARAQIGTSTFTIDSQPTGEGVACSVVNDGFGVNQLLYMLTICLYSQFKIVAIEEPEIHLHPSLVRKLAITMPEIAAKEDRRLVVSTHSETFVVALLAQIAAGKLNVDDVSFILAENQNGETRFTRCDATSEGQIHGGLEAFMASEAEDLLSFLSLGT